MNDHNRQNWKMVYDWRTVEHQFWESQRLQDVQQWQQIAELQRMATEARQEGLNMKGDLSYLTDIFDKLNTHLLSPPQND